MKNSKFRVCLVTTSRADFGLQRILIERFQNDPRCDFQLVVSGAHMVDGTVEEIVSSQLKIANRIPICKDRTELPAKIVATALERFTDYFARERPDICIILGDRFEMVGVALAAVFAGVKIAHLHGGEITEGALDDSIRHCLTKLSHLHFTSTESSRRRVIQMGEEPGHVHAVGVIGLEASESLQVLDRKQLEQELGISFESPVLLVTLHSTTHQLSQLNSQVEALISALEDASNDFHILITAANLDEGGEYINQRMREFVRLNPRSRFVESLGSVRYWSVLRYAAAVIGNSSSGIVEAPHLLTPVINIGDRQKGRERVEWLLDVPFDKQAIRGAIRKVTSSDYREQIKALAPSPYSVGGRKPSVMVVEKVIQACSEELGQKKFFDLSTELAALLSERHL